MRCLSSGRTIPRSVKPGRSTALRARGEGRTSRSSKEGSTPPNGSGRRSSTCSVRMRASAPPHSAGWNTATGLPPASPASRMPPASGGAAARRATRRCGMNRSAASPPKSSSSGSTRSCRDSGAASTRRRRRATGRPASSRRNGAPASGSPQPCASASALSMRIWGRWEAGSLPTH